MYKIKILHILSKLNRGGAELRILESLDYYTDVDFHFLLLSGQKGELDEEFRKRGATLHYLKLKSFAFPTSFIKLVRNNRIDIVHSHIFFSSSYIVILAKLFTKAATISHFRTASLPKKSVYYKMRSKLLKFILIKFSDKIIFVSNTARKKLFGIKENSKMLVIYNGIKQPQFKSNSIRKNRIVHVGRFNEAKNQLFLLNVIKELKYLNLTIPFHLYGDFNTEYGERFKENNSFKEVFTEGVIHDIPKELVESKIFVFPSVREGLPGALIEACLSGCIIIASDIEENIEIQKHFPEQITILPLSDDLWAKEIKDIFNRDKTQSIGIKDNPFLIEKNVEEMLKVYKDLLVRKIKK